MASNRLHSMLLLLPHDVLVKIATHVAPSTGQLRLTCHALRDAVNNVPGDTLSFSGPDPPDLPVMAARTSSLRLRNVNRLPSGLTKLSSSLEVFDCENEYHIDIQPVDLSGLAVCENIRMFSMNSDGSLVDFTSMMPIHSLHTVALSYVTVEHLDALEGCRMLSTLHLIDCKFQRLPVIPTLKALIALGVEDSDMSALAQLSNLEHLSLDSGIPEASSQLSTLSVQCMAWEVQDVARFPDLTMLQFRTDFSDLDAVHDVNLSPVAAMQKLTHLSLCSGVFQDLSRLSTMNSLHALKLENDEGMKWEHDDGLTWFKEFDVSSLASLPNLSVLSVNDKCVGINMLHRLTELRISSKIMQQIQSTQLQPSVNVVVFEDFDTLFMAEW